MIPRPNRKTGRDKTCKCGATFYCPKWDWEERQFCSKICGYKYKSYGYEWTEKQREAVSVRMTGVKLSEEHKKKIGDFWRGKKFSPERKAQHLLVVKRGVESPVWIQDRTKLKRDNRRNDSAYQVWRKEVWLRDGFLCRITTDDCKGRIEVHHILSWREYPELRYQINNGITLCHLHHPRKREEEKRLIAEFQQLVSAPSVYLA